MTINPRTSEAYQLFHEGVLAFARAEQQGIRVDLEYIESKKIHLTRKIERLEEQFKSTNFYKHWEHSTKGNININSNAQLSHFLYDIKKIKVERETDSGQGSTDDETLRQMDIPELESLLEMRKLRKVRDTYLDAFFREQVNGYIHPFFNLHLVRTYRSSSDSPNFQNIPKRDEEAMRIVRRALFPRPGHQLLEIDFSGLEVRIAACYHKDPTMLKYINNPASDMHADMAKQLFVIDKFDKSLPEHKVLRQAAKNGFVFPEFYGDYYKNCAINMACNWGKLRQGTWKPGEGIAMEGGTLSDHLISKGLPSLLKFTEHVRKIEADFWGKRFKEYSDWKDRWYKVYKKYGYVDLLTGFRCSGIMSKNDCINYPVQGAAFHVNLKSFTLLDKACYSENWDTKIIGQIHDSIILDVLPNELNHVAAVAHKITCEDVPSLWKWINVPLDVEMELCPVDASWTEKQKFSLK
jgi:DNA polymerase I-like protein with 3'-5' exonuclease and polymerase domains